MLLQGAKTLNLVLLVGGSRDGDRLPLSGAGSVVTVASKPFPEPMPQSDGSLPSTVHIDRTEQYARWVLGEGIEQVVVYAAPGIGPGDILRRLVDQYRA
jgi:hypothetical protein